MSRIEQSCTLQCYWSSRRNVRRICKWRWRRRYRGSELEGGKTFVLDVLSILSLLISFFFLQTLRRRTRSPMVVKPSRVSSASVMATINSDSIRSSLKRGSNVERPASSSISSIFVTEYFLCKITKPSGEAEGTDLFTAHSLNTVDCNYGWTVADITIFSHNEVCT